MKIAAYTELRHLDLIDPEDFARPTDRVVFRMIEIVNVIDVGANLRREKLRVHRRFLGAGVAGQPCEVRERKGLRCW